MFSRRPSQSTKESFGKKNKTKRSSFREHGVSKSRRQRSFKEQNPPVDELQTPTRDAPLIDAIITIIVGPERRVFAAHEQVLSTSSFFASALASQFYASPISVYSPGTPGSTSSSSSNKRITLADESPEVFSSILEYLYKGDYYPRLILNKRKNTYELEKGENGQQVETTLYHASPLLRGNILKDSLIYCSALRYQLPSLCELALKKQGLVSGITVSTIIASARYSYANTPETDSKLRAHYLALIIRSRETFKRSGTMQMEMQKGGSPLWFDLFVAMANHVDDVASVQNSPRSMKGF